MNTPSRGTPRTLFGAQPIKVLFAAEYVLQGLANPFQGITYQPFFRHFKELGVDEAEIQRMFARSYLAWSFKPLLGFVMDAYGQTRTTLLALLAGATAFYMAAPLFDLGAEAFFWTMFTLSALMACTDVAVDRATVVVGEEEARATGRSKAATVGLNQAICWTAIYGTGIIAKVSGGWVADHVPFGPFLFCLALAPMVVFFITTRLERDHTPTRPLRRSISDFWSGLNTGPILWVMFFSFLFHFQPSAGTLLNNYTLETLKFSQTDVGFADGGSYVGYLIGTLVFAKWGVRWQDQLGLRRLFQIFIAISVAMSLTQLVLLDPWFSSTAHALDALLPFASAEQSRLVLLIAYNIALYSVTGFIRMSTFSVVGAVIPAAAAGSLFAGFMSISNVAYSLSFASGAWLYDHGMSVGPLRAMQESLFGAAVDGKLSLGMLILTGSLAYLLSYLAAHKLPDRRETLAGDEAAAHALGPTQHATLGASLLRAVNASTVVGMGLFFALAYFGAGIQFIAAVMVAFFGTAFVRKVVLDGLYTRRRASAAS